MNVGEVLDGAANVIEQRGWYQGDFHDDFHDIAGAVCALGAINVVCTGAPCRLSAFVDLDYHYPLVASEAAAFVAATVGADYISAWNDDPSRTKSEVLAAFRAAAILWRAQQAQATVEPAALEPA